MTIERKYTKIEILIFANNLLRICNLMLHSKLFDTDGLNRMIKKIKDCQKGVKHSLNLIEILDDLQHYENIIHEELSKQNF